MFFKKETELLIRYELEEYIIIIRMTSNSRWDEIDEFKVLFREWVKSFDVWNYIVDDWGLFNPPGIEYDENEGD